MSMMIPILVFVLFNGVYSQCPPLYVLCSGRCVYIPPDGAPYCNAWQTCLGLKGRLATSTEVDVTNSCRQGYVQLWIGLTDLLNEMYTSKNGWLWTDGSVTSNPALWTAGEPNNLAEDCVASSSTGLLNSLCGNSKMYTCYYDNTTVSQQRYFANTATIYNNDSELGCQDVYVVQSVIECGIKCKTTSYCKSFYFEDSQKHCVITKYVDSSLPQSYNNGTYNWKRYN